MRRLFISFLLSYSFNCLAQPVSPDLFFGNNCYSLFANSFTGLNAHFEDVAVQKDGKVVAVGRMETSTTGDNRNDFLTVRYNTDSSLDHSFRNNGAVLTDFGLTSDDATCTVRRGMASFFSFRKYV
jgi:hypothetical protein